jgi:hypothetical protein
MGEVECMWLDRIISFFKRQLTVAGAVVVFALTFILMLAVSAGQTGAAWVQAVGSIVAIVGAAAFPYMHEADKVRLQRDRLRSLLLLLARDQLEPLRMLSSTVQKSVGDSSKERICSYLDGGWHFFWPAHQEALNAIPIADLEPYQVSVLGSLKVSAMSASEIISQLDHWDISGHSQIAYLVRLKTCTEMSSLSIEQLSRAGGGKSV